MTFDTSRYIIVKFGKGFTNAERGPILLEMERVCRKITGQYDEVFLERLNDDSKLRSSMTPEERAKL